MSGQEAMPSGCAQDKGRAGIQGTTTGKDSRRRSDRFLKEMVPDEGDKQAIEGREKMSPELVCPACGLTRPVDDKKVPENARWAICPRCKIRFPFSRGQITRLQAASYPASLGGSGEKDITGAQGHESAGFFGLAMAASISAACSPRRFFSSSALKYSLRESFAAGLLMGGAGAMLAFLGKVLFYGPGDAFFGISPDGGGMGIAWLIRGLAAGPVYAAINIIASSIFLHLCLLIVRGGKNGFGATFRVTALSQFPYLLSFVPYAGYWIAVLWSWVLYLVGLKEIHQIGYGRVLAGLFVAFGFLGIFALGVALNMILGILRTAF